MADVGRHRVGRPSGRPTIGSANIGAPMGEPGRRGIRKIPPPKTQRSRRETIGKPSIEPRYMPSCAVDDACDRNNCTKNTVFPFRAPNPPIPPRVANEPSSTFTTSPRSVLPLESAQRTRKRNNKSPRT